jgi:hypothetical protein
MGRSNSGVNLVFLGDKLNFEKRSILWNFNESLKKMPDLKIHPIDYQRKSHSLFYVEADISTLLNLVSAEAFVIRSGMNDFILNGPIKKEFFKKFNLKSTYFPKEVYLSKECTKQRDQIHSSLAGITSLKEHGRLISKELNANKKCVYNINVFTKSILLLSEEQENFRSYLSLNLQEFSKANRDYIEGYLTFIDNFSKWVDFFELEYLKFAKDLKLFSTKTKTHVSLLAYPCRYHFLNNIIKKSSLEHDLPLLELNKKFPNKLNCQVSSIESKNYGEDLFNFIKALRKDMIERQDRRDQWK